MIGSLWTDANSGTGLKILICLLCLSYQNVPLQKKSRFDGDADARLAVTLNITAKEKTATSQTTSLDFSVKAVKLITVQPITSGLFFWCCSHDPHRQLTIPYLLQQRPSQSVNHGAALGWVRVLVSTWLCSRESGIKERRVLMGIMWEEVGRNMIRGDRFALSYCVGCKRVYSVDTFVRTDVE